ncbi:hypothetical protein NF556_01050 [Ornithinimicrobium faecis]|uniref:Ribosomal protein L7/L12 C-terminal domain-containing protein n=1 Tax=Ornithinimicrobium faecis TaxID=2934158 RepID=A0ABY4YUZ1_9MICO|nr:hypothetical protein [Ornithinimicrobium sp. HY1793]USQ80280.1 hypothetical protein NF556_01050 [Ornithinimicrobium sp. HY1793]
MGLFGPDHSSEIAGLRMQVSQLEQRVEQLAQLIGAPPVPRDARLDEVFNLKQSGQQIAAIKRLRELRPGLGLAEAKAIVDEM